MAKGNFIEYVVSNNPNKYPNDGEQGGYYWECVGKPIISFTINGTSYQAEEGMTWGEWCESSYNTGGVRNVDGYYIEYNDLSVAISHYPSSPTPVMPSDKIIHLQKYIITAASGGTGN